MQTNLFAFIRVHSPSVSFPVKNLLITLLLLASLAGCEPASPISPPTLTTSPTPASTPSALSKIARQSLTIDFGDFQSQAELTYPEDAASPSPTLILLHGSAAADMDYQRYSSWGEQKLLSHNFLDIANYLAQRGIAVLRFNKHYVTSTQAVDWERYDQNITLQVLLADADKVLQTAQANPHVDREHIFILGWSEGSVIAAALAVAHPELAGLVLQGAVTRPFRDVTESQVLSVGIQYLRSLAPDGLVTTDTILTAINGTGGDSAKNVVRYFIDLDAAQRGEIIFQPGLDADRDGAISIDDEFLPGLAQTLDLEFSGTNLYAAQNALPSTTQQAADLKLPLLIMQGENDAHTLAQDLHFLEDALRSADHPDTTVILYPSLGHSLGLAFSLVADNFRPIAHQPLEDLLAWLLAHSR